MQTSRNRSIESDKSGATSRSPDEHLHATEFGPGGLPSANLYKQTTISEPVWRRQSELHPLASAPDVPEADYTMSGTPLPPNTKHPLQEQSEGVHSLSNEVSQAGQSVQTVMSPWLVKKPRALGGIIRKPLNVTEQRVGALYVFSKESHPGYLKIGRTSGKVKRRINQWRRQCGQELICEYEINSVPNVSRLEKLIHLELVRYRHQEDGCDGDNCGHAHTEWFQIDVEVAKVVIDKWHRWIEEVQPYDDEGILKENSELPTLSFPLIGEPTHIVLPITRRRRVADDSVQTELPFPITKKAVLEDNKAYSNPFTGCL